MLEIGYDVESLTSPSIRAKYHGKVATDHYGRRVPLHSHGTTNFEAPTSSARKLIESVLALYDKIANPVLLIRRITISANHLEPEGFVSARHKCVQLDLFTDVEEQERKLEAEKKSLAKERRGQEAILRIKKQFGKNAILKGVNFDIGATQINRNSQIGGHQA